MEPQGPSAGYAPIGPGPYARGTAGWIFAGALLLGLFALGSVALFAHNTMLGRAEAVDAAWAQVDSTLQRRADLVPRLVQVVKQAAQHESQVLGGVTGQRTAATEALAQALRTAEEARAGRPSSEAGAPAGETELAELARRDAAVAREIHNVFAVAESYPVLRASDAFLELQAQLEGTENRIHAARTAFNDAVRRYNAALVALPTSLVARAQGLERRSYFRAAEEARVAGALDFD